MTHQTRAVTAAMLATATARPERATDEVITDLAERLTQAIETTQGLAVAPCADDESHTMMATRMIRLEGKAQGLKVALSYVREAQRAEAPDPRAEQWQRALGMYGADAAHGPDCDTGGCNACILSDVHRIIYGASRPGAEG
jgi:hypothetical protein